MSISKGIGISEIEITILNWDKYQLRKEIKNPSWFRLEHRFWNDQQFFHFSAEERWIWVCLLSITSQKQSPTFKLNLEWFSVESRVGIQTIHDALQKLKDNECLDFTTRARHVQELGRSTTRHNKTEQNKTLQKPFSVESKPILIQTPTVFKKDLSFFINQKLLELYPQEYLDREKVKMEMWLATNGHKRPKSDRGMFRFVTGWLSRGWDQYRKGLQSNAPKEKTWQELLEEDERKSKDGH